MGLLVPMVLVWTGLSAGAAPSYDPDLARWQEVVVPPKTRVGDRAVWFYAANYSKHEWRVYTQSGRAQARLTTEKAVAPEPTPSFAPKARGTRYQEVDDGWLVGLNRGEFGAALSWRSRDGKQGYKISDDQIVGFFRLPDGLYAVEGLAHMGLSRGSVVRIDRPEGEARWRTTNVATLPFAPYAVATRRKGTAVVVLSGGIVSFDPRHGLRTLFKDAPWQGLYPNSAVLSDDERKLDIGMRQFVGEFDLAKGGLRLLVPSRSFLNRLSKDDERIVRAQAGR